jgi:hypothetical protein
MIQNKIENNFNKEADAMKNEIVDEMNLKCTYENGNQMIENLSNEREVTKMKK